MKAIICLIIIFLASPVFGMPDNEVAREQVISQHKSMIYPVVRVTVGKDAGSGTIIYSKDSGDGEYSTYVLTNHHVIESGIKVSEVWDPDVGKDVRRERRGIAHVEIFQYRDISTPIGTLRVEADIVLYNQIEDMALLKLRSEDKASYVAQLAPKGYSVHTMEPTVAVGCSLAFPPLPTRGILTRKNYLIDSLPYHMSSAQIIYGNSGGAMFDGFGRLIGIPSRGVVVGWGTPVTHMGMFIPIDRFYDWLESEYYDFIWTTTSEKEGMEKREKEIEKRKDR